MLLASALPLASSLFPLSVHGPDHGPEELPYALFEERLAAIETLLLEYRVVSADSEDLTLRVAYRAPGDVHVEVNKGALHVEFWNDGETYTVLQLEGEQRSAIAMDLEETFLPGLEWLQSFSEEFLENDSDFEPTALTNLSLWPSDEEGSTWEFNCSGGMVSRAGASLELTWLEQMRNLEVDAEPTERGWAVDLEGGARFELDGDLGYLVHGMIDPADASKGELTLLRSEVGLEHADDEFDVQIPEGIETSDPAFMQGPMRGSHWESLRADALGGLLQLEDEARAEVLASEEFEELMETFYLARLGPALEDIGGQLREAVGAPARRLQDFVEANEGNDEAQAEAEKAAKQLREQVARECEKAGKAVSKGSVRRPPYLDGDDQLAKALDTILERETEIAATTVEESLGEVLDELLEEIIGELGAGDSCHG